MAGVPDVPAGREHLEDDAATAPCAGPCDRSFLSARRATVIRSALRLVFEPKSFLSQLMLGQIYESSTWRARCQSSPSRYGTNPGTLYNKHVRNPVMLLVSTGSKRRTVPLAQDALRFLHNTTQKETKECISRMRTILFGTSQLRELC